LGEGDPPRKKVGDGAREGGFVNREKVTVPGGRRKEPVVSPEGNVVLKRHPSAGLREKTPNEGGYSMPVHRRLNGAKKWISRGGGCVFECHRSDFGEKRKKLAKRKGGGQFRDLYLAGGESTLKALRRRYSVGAGRFDSKK